MCKCQISTRPKPDWEDIEHAVTTLQGISSMLCVILETKSKDSYEYHSIEGVIQLAEFQEKKLSQLNPFA